MTFEHVVALAKRGELTPTTAAEVTGLTVEEASEILAELAEKGQLRRMTQSDPRIFGLPSRDEGWQ